MKPKVILIGGNLRINGISGYNMAIFNGLRDEFEFIFINTAPGETHLREEILSKGGRVYDVIAGGSGPLRSFKQARMIRRIIRAEQPVVVHSHYFSNNGIYLRQAFLENVPIRISQCNNAPQWDELGFGKRMAVSSSRRLAGRYATHLFACSDNAREFLYGDRGEVIYYPLDYSSCRLTDEDCYEKYSLDRSRRYFLFTGRLTKIKNVSFLVDVFNELPEDCVLMVQGYGPEEASLRRQVKDNGQRNVLFFDMRAPFTDLLSIAHGMLLPSYHEGISIITLQTQACGVRCLLSENITRECQMGLSEYLPLEKKVWVSAILGLSSRKLMHEPKYDSRFDRKYILSYLRGVYEGLSSDQWIERGKEYTLGSSRFHRDKDLCQDCFRIAHGMGNPRGTFYYALGFFEGTGTPMNKRRARELVEPVIARIEAESQKGVKEYVLIMGDMFSFGLGKNQDYETALSFYQRAADMGSLEAMCDLGYMYQVGQGTAVDKELSAHWYKLSADSGYLHSIRDIGLSYLKGEGVSVDPAQACRYFEMASRRNYSHGTTDLAYCYLMGTGVEKDLRRAEELYLLALEQDRDRAMRDIFANRIDVGRLTSGGGIMILEAEDELEISDRNMFDGCLYVATCVRSIDPACFYSADVRKIFVEKDNASFTAVGGVLFNKDRTVLIRYPPTNPDTEYVVPCNVKVVGPHAFQNCRRLKSVVLDEGLVEIGDSAFDDCKNLVSVNLPPSVTYIGPWAFHGCDSVEHFTVPARTVRIGTYAFGSCVSLLSIDVDEGNTAYRSLDGDLYDRNVSTLVQYSIGKPDSRFVMPGSVRHVEFRAFSDAAHLVELDCGNVTSIPEKCMYCCESLRRITCRQGTRFGDRALENTSPELETVVIG